MPKEKCPMCDSPCIIKIIATGDARWCEVDVCQMCGTMYPRGRTVVQVKSKKKPGTKSSGKRPRKKPGK